LIGRCSRFIAEPFHFKSGGDRLRQMKSSKTYFPAKRRDRTPPSPDELSESPADVSGSEVALRRLYTDSLLGFLAAYPKRLTGGNGANRGGSDDSKAARSHRL